ncbi:MAG: hypothetical protein Q7V19_14865 [Bacteroidales bacterium]|nr:hypothetical protein [Bacteroidales bacterium]MDP2236619.1 hypothetical protein [Bacteroidales bacterium]
MKQKKMNVRGKTGQNPVDKSKTDNSDETAIMEKLKLQNTALEKIKTAVYANNGNSQDEGE